MNYADEWNKWIKSGIDLLMETIKATPCHKTEEIYSRKLDLPSVSSLSILSENADIQLSFSSDSPRYTVLASRNIDKSAVKVSANTAGDVYTLTVKERLPHEDQNVNVHVRFCLPNQFKSVSVASKNGDILLKKCKSPKTRVSTVSGDILVSKHITPCTVKAKSKNGDVSRSSHYSRFSSNELICRTDNGDILIG